MGKGYSTCTVCNGVGMVDKVRRGGTDTDGKWLGKDKQAMDPLTPQVCRSRKCFAAEALGFQQP